jgi:hypothetical protein
MTVRTSAALLLLLLCLPALAAAHQPTPDGVVSVPVFTDTLTLWPYLSSDFQSPSDPVNLVFPDADPRAIREALMKLDGTRPAFATIPGADCRWTDAMGYEQAAWVEPERWVAGAVQLACVNPGKPLGGPFRFHVRLFRSGPNTVGGAHYEFNITGTAEHAVLSWDLARSFVAYDLARTGALLAAPATIPALIPPGTFRAVLRPVFEGLQAGGAGPLLAGLGLVEPVSPTADVPIPTSGAALAFRSLFPYDASLSDVTTVTDVQYSVIAPKPFCNGPTDYVKLEGPLHFTLRVRTTSWGAFVRTYGLEGTLKATPVNPLTGAAIGPARDAVISERHGALLTDHIGEITERVSQVLQGVPEQSLKWGFAAGGLDFYDRDVSCGLE